MTMNEESPTRGLMHILSRLSARLWLVYFDRLVLAASNRNYVINIAGLMEMERERVDNECACHFEVIVRSR